MKILFIADNFPQFGSGSSVRNFYLLKALSQNNTIDIVGFTDKNSDVSPIPLHGVEYFTIKRNPLNMVKRLALAIAGKIPYIEQRKALTLPPSIKSKLSSYDLIHISELNSFFVFEKYLHLTQAPIILDAHNIDYVRFLAEFNNKPLFQKILGKVSANRIKKLEADCVRKVKHLLVCSDVDKNYFKKFLSEEKISVIPNGIDASYFKKSTFQPSSKDRIVLFMGLLSYFPNQEGISYYLSEIHPKIRMIIPDVQLHIIGKNPSNSLLEYEKKDTSVKVFGYVKDQRPYIAKANVCIAPLLSGSGTRLKILEYMALGKAVVSTPQGAEGIDVKDKENILLARDTVEFVTSVIELMKQNTLAKKIGRNAKKLVEEKYNWEQIGRKVVTLYENING